MTHVADRLPVFRLGYYSLPAEEVELLRLLLRLQDREDGGRWVLCRKAPFDAIVTDASSARVPRRVEAMLRIGCPILLLARGPGEPVDPALRASTLVRPLKAGPIRRWLTDLARSSVSSSVMELAEGISSFDLSKPLPLDFEQSQSPLIDTARALLATPVFDEAAEPMTDHGMVLATDMGAYAEPVAPPTQPMPHSQAEPASWKTVQDTALPPLLPPESALAGFPATEAPITEAPLVQTAMAAALSTATPIAEAAIDPTLRDGEAAPPPSDLAHLAPQPQPQPQDALPEARFLARRREPEGEHASASERYRSLVQAWQEWRQLGVEVDTSARYKLNRWPTTQWLAGDAQRLRIASLLARKPLMLDEVAASTGVSWMRCQAVFCSLLAAGWLDASEPVDAAPAGHGDAPGARAAMAATPAHAAPADASADAAGASDGLHDPGRRSGWRLGSGLIAQIRLRLQL